MVAEMLTEMMREYLADTKEAREEIVRQLRQLRINTLIKKLETGEIKKGEVTRTTSGWKARIFEVSGKLLVGKVYPPSCSLGINAYWDYLGREIHNSPMFDIE